MDEWISVKDRFPMEDEVVFAAVKKKSQNSEEYVYMPATYESGERSEERLVGKGWYEETYYGHYGYYDAIYDKEILDEVTHWMPLPNPPEV